jgi:hypothetical protein
MDAKTLRRNPHVRLLLANARDRGVHLSAEDVESLVKFDDAINQAAMNIVEDAGYDSIVAATTGKLVKLDVEDEPKPPASNIINWFPPERS